MSVNSAERVEGSSDLTSMAPTVPEAALITARAIIVMRPYLVCGGSPPEDLEVIQATSKKLTEYYVQHTGEVIWPLPMGGHELSIAITALELVAERSRQEEVYWVCPENAESVLNMWRGHASLLREQRQIGACAVGDRTLDNRLRPKSKASGTDKRLRADNDEWWTE